PQEKVRIKVIKVGKKFAIGKCLELIKTSPHRQEVENEDLLRTGIAPLSHLSYQQQLLFKQDQVENVIKKVAKMPEIKVAPTMGMKKPGSYRNKAQIPVQKIHGQLTTGFYHKNSHRLVSVDDFMIQDKKIDQAIAIVR